MIEDASLAKWIDCATNDNHNDLFFENLVLDTLINAKDLSPYDNKMKLAIIQKKANRY